MSEDPGSRCPRCGAELHPDQDWCLECGAPARTRLAPTPNWRIPAALVAVVVALAGAGLAVAFVRLTDDGAAPVAAATTSTTPADGGVPATPVTPGVTSSIATSPPPAVGATPTTETQAPPPSSLPGTTTPPGTSTPATPTQTTPSTQTTGTTSATTPPPVSGAG
jgi:hypothetical protein